MKSDPVIIAAIIGGLFALGAAYLSSNSGIRMEGNRSVVYGGNAVSNGGTAISNVTNTIMDQRVAADGGAVVIQNSNNNGGSRLIINGKIVDTSTQK